MRILVTNDDGINAPGLKVLEAIAAEIAGEEGEVWVVAPAFEQSGVGHMISYVHPTMIAELAPRRYAAEGSPADCVLAGIYHVLGGERPDLVLSGVNRGNNAAENALYSGTIGGAMEGALQRLPSIALSQYYGPDNARSADPFSAARAWGVETVRRILAHGDWGGDGYTTFYNVNFPPVPGEAVKGLRAAPQGLRPGVFHSVEGMLSPGGRRFLWVRGGDQTVRPAEGSDAAVNLDGWVSVTPMRADLTAHDALDPLEAALT
ncbi:5'/3'-nucleotidase SurE [Histidinibacterium lentulum]|uniref:5'-nucleotidase SurE n=1 Tax=Histidinibacterium lentulum TaxID=2480588 RepID=A0A3N2QLP8_9RHOB|nr:5'/3'-nucleotidase SurE [Histidinibacterium lentulum]ROT96120.1 5'/3'-nucleotidase SurE [Histidinibacterium lentulum]